MPSDGPTTETLVAELEQVFARHNKLFQGSPEAALALTMQALDERRCSLGVGASVDPIHDGDCWMVRFGGEHAAMLGVSERTMSYFEELREIIRDEYDADVLMRDHGGERVDV